MYRYAKKYSKKIMAVLSVVLMVIFVISTASSVNSGHDVKNPVQGHIGETEILASDVQQAQAEWDLLTKNTLVIASVPPRFPGMPPQQEFVPLNLTLGGDFNLGQRLWNQIRSNPEFFLLLKKEAQQMGVQISADRFESALRNEVRTSVAGQQPIPVADLDPNNRETQNLRQSILDFMTVQAAFDRVASTVKVSQPLRQHTVASEFQRIAVDLIEFPSGDYLTKVTPPTTQQVDEQFKTYADISAGAPSKTNPHGFGYRYPDRVKLQYIQVPRADLVAAAQNKRTLNDDSRYQWKKDAFIFYRDNQNLFATTQPAASQPSFLLQNKSPTTRPFDEVVDRAQQLVVQNDADKLSTAIEVRITAIFNDDYTSYSRALSSSATTAPVAAPNSSLGVPYNTYEYYQKVALVIQKEFGVLPQTTALDRDYQNQGELTVLPGIGGAYYKSIEFPRYAIAFSQDLAADQQPRPEAANLNLFEPSQPLHDEHSDLYFFRLTDAQKSHAPADKAEVISQIEADLRDVGAYSLAEADAKKFLSSIKIPSTLFTAASSAGKKLIHAGPFSSRNLPQNYTLAPAAMSKFIHDSYDMLSLVTSADSHPLKEIDLPSGRHVLVAQLTNILANWRDGELPIRQWQVDGGLYNTLRRQLAIEWFDYDGVAARLGYKEENPGASKKRHSAPLPPIDPLGAIGS